MATKSKGKGRPRKPNGKRRFWNYPRSHVRGIRRWLPSWRVLLGVTLWSIALVAGLLVAAYATTTVPDEMSTVNYQTSTVYWADGTVAARYADQNRTKIDYSTLPACDGKKQYGSADNPVGEACFANAVVASEDSTFWSNSGVDPKGIVRAFVNNVSGGNRQGASTLTQQYVSNYLNTGKLDSYKGKFKEAMLALKVNQQKSKEQIMEGYVNTIYFGRGSYGIEAAAQSFYGKHASELTYSEAAMIAGIIPSPNKWDPVNNHEMAVSRWQRTINYMYKEGFITAQQKADAKFPEPITPKVSSKYSGTNGYLLKYAETELEQDAKIDIKELQRNGYKVTLTINPKMQSEAVKVMNSIPRSGPGAASPNMHGSLVTIDPKTGAILAMYGGPDFMKSQWNTATQAGAQAGSTFKPFTLIGAMEEGIPLTQTYSGANRMRLPGWNKPVTNFGNANYGTIDLVDATANSVNTVYAQLNDEIGPQKTVDVAKKAGIESTVPAVPSNVLGTATVTNLELTNAYATFAADGVRTTPHIVASVKDPDGDTIYSGPTTGTQEIDPNITAGATYAMTQVVQRGSGTDARALNRPVAGKSGTTNDNKSAWFAGFVPQYATVVGLYQTTPDGKGQASITPFGGYSTITGGSWPCQAWTEYMQAVLKDVPVEQFPTYKGIKSKATRHPTESPTATATQAPTPTSTPTPEPTHTQPPAPTGVTVPSDLAGRSQDAALAELSALGLRGQVTKQYSDTIAEGQVIAVARAGTQVPKGSTVAIVVSAGPDPAGGGGGGGGDGGGGGQNGHHGG